MLDAAGEHLLILPDTDALHQHLAESIADEISRNNAGGRPTRLILPVGPVGQYPILAQRIVEQQISLRRCWFFFMDEYCDDNGDVVPPEHPLSFRGVTDRVFFAHVPDQLTIPAPQRVFPDQQNVDTLQQMIEAAGGIDTCYGGIGIHGHVAFNEPAPEIARSEPRRVDLNDFTRTINCIRSQVGGNLVNFPRQAITLGMRQILEARRIRLYCRNGIGLDWANTVLRLALFGQPGDDYPVTHIRNHPDYVLVTDQDTAQTPKFVI
jgi:glucosamine-6-phosphate deaminase